jgi:hypothetical protein
MIVRVCETGLGCAEDGDRRYQNKRRSKQEKADIVVDGKPVAVDQKTMPALRN